ncbi:hypothetical protein [Kitasatospora sp. NPDC005856]|uniref:hypothetical protein n=1 Tax=Kitasatospora sp. NPDC005856 TaxID=3154566 RepID=UPI0033F742CC
MTDRIAARPAWSVRLWQYRDNPHRGWTNRLFSDAEVIGAIDGAPIGPYTITELAVPVGHEPGQPRPVLELASWFRDPEGEPSASGSAGWTGLLIHQEIAALLSLVLGIRLRGDDPLIRRRLPDGRINTYEVAGRVVPSAPTPSWASPIIPGLSGRRADFASVRGHLESLPRLSPQYTVQLVRAARQYADALWIAEGEPELAWLMLVSAVEVAATSHQVATEDYTLLLKKKFPRAAEALLAAGGEELLAEAATTEFTGLINSTSRFLNFARTFRPGPPSLRTTDTAAQLSWSSGKMRDAFNKVYDHRSSRLHAGVAFPWPLLIPPPAAGDGLPAEVFAGGPYGSGDTTWPAAELPMTLALFAHLVRGMLLRWWTVMADEAATGAG